MLKIATTVTGLEYNEIPYDDKIKYTYPRRHGGFGFSNSRNQLYGAFVGSYLEALYPGGLDINGDMMKTDYCIREMSNYVKKLLPHIPSDTRICSHQDPTIEDFYTAFMPFNFDRLLQARQANTLPPTLGSFYRYM